MVHVHHLNERFPKHRRQKHVLEVVLCKFLPSKQNKSRKLRNLGFAFLLMSFIFVLFYASSSSLLFLLEFSILRCPSIFFCNKVSTKKFHMLKQSESFPNHVPRIPLYHIFA